MKQVLFSVAILLGISSDVAFAETDVAKPAGQSETIVREDIGCFHQETLKQLDRLFQIKGDAISFIGNQLMSGECSNLRVGTSVRVDQRIKGPNRYGQDDICIVPTGSSEPCRWVTSGVID
jgi:hypothetical protein